MSQRISDLGDIVSGAAGVNLNAVQILALDATEACWPDHSTIAAQIQTIPGNDSSWQVQSFPKGTPGTRTVVFAGGANWVRAGGGVILHAVPGTVRVQWADLSTATIGGAVYPVCVSPAGVIVTTDAVQTAVAIRNQAGAIWSTTAPGGMGGDAVSFLDCRLDDPWLSMRSYGAGTQLLSISTLAPYPSFVGNPAARLTIPIATGGVPWVVERTDPGGPTSIITARPANSASGLLVANVAAFGLDAQKVGSDLHIGWWTGAGLVPAVAQSAVITNFLSASIGPIVPGGGVTSPQPTDRRVFSFGMAGKAGVRRSR